MKEKFTLLALVLVLALTGCAAHNSAKDADNKYDANDKYIDKLAQKMQDRGLMSKPDFIAAARLDGIVGAGRRLNDSDFSELMELMKVHQPTVRYSPSMMSITTHVNAMGTCRDMRVPTPDQKQQMVAAVTPLLNSPDKNERSLARQIVNKYKLLN